MTALIGLVGLMRRPNCHSGGTFWDLREYAFLFLPIPIARVRASDAYDGIINTRYYPKTGYLKGYYRHQTDCFFTALSGRFIAMKALIGLLCRPNCHSGGNLWDVRDNGILFPPTPIARVRASDAYDGIINTRYYPKAGSLNCFCRPQADPGSGPGIRL